MLARVGFEDGVDVAAAQLLLKFGVPSMLSRIAIISGSVAAAWEAMACRSIVWMMDPVTPKYKVKAMMIVPTIR